MNIKNSLFVLIVVSSCMVNAMDKNAKNFDAVKKLFVQETGCVLQLDTSSNTVRETLYDCVIPAYMRQCGIAEDIIPWRVLNAPGLITKEENDCVEPKLTAFNQKIEAIKREFDRNK